MTVLEIYQKFSIPLNLQRHMLRVAAVAQHVITHWQGPKIESELILKTCLLHDLGNILKFDFTKLDLFDPLDRKRIAYYTQQQEVFRQKYGDDPDQASLKMIAEVTPDHKLITLCQESRWYNTNKFLPEKDWEKKITCYADMRVGPFGVVPLAKRFDDLHQRRPDQKQLLDRLFPYALKLETDLEFHTDIFLPTIDDQIIADSFIRLKTINV